MSGEKKREKKKMRDPVTGNTETNPAFLTRISSVPLKKGTPREEEDQNPSTRGKNMGEKEHKTISKSTRRCSELQSCRGRRKNKIVQNKG